MLSVACVLQPASRPLNEVLLPPRALMPIPDQLRRLAVGGLADARKALLARLGSQITELERASKGGTASERLRALKALEVVLNTPVAPAAFDRTSLLKAREATVTKLVNLRAARAARRNGPASVLSEKTDDLVNQVEAALVQTLNEIDKELNVKK